MLTVNQKRRLAIAARGLASDIVEGRGPPLIHYDYCGCAIGEILKRGLGLHKDEIDKYTELAEEIDLLLPDDAPYFYGEGLVSAALRHDPTGAALPFPLLALADVLDAQPSDKGDSK